MVFDIKFCLKFTLEDVNSFNFLGVLLIIGKNRKIQEYLRNNSFWIFFTLFNNNCRNLNLSSITNIYEHFLNIVNC